MKDFISKVGKKTIIIVSMFIILVIVVLFGGALIYNKLFYKKTYTEIEDIMLNAGKEYYADHSDRLPKELNGKISISSSALVKDSRMKSIKEYLKDDSIKCNGSVSVTNLGKKYRYVPILDCGDNYKTKTFIDYLKEKVSIVEKGNGLYKVNDEFVFRGDTVDNYAMIYTKLDKYKKKYRIVKFTDDYIELIYTDKLEPVNWDNRYNIEKEDVVGINDYNVSSIKEYLQKLYNGKSIFNNYAKSLIIPYSIPIGKRSETDADKTGSLETASVVDNQYIGLLPLYDFLSASLDSNCKSSVSMSCQNYNYLGKYRSSWWTSTANKSDTYRVFKIDGMNYGNMGYPVLARANSDFVPRFVIRVSKDALLVSGKGTTDNPYMIK